MKPLRPPRDTDIYIGCAEKFGRIPETVDSFLLPDDGKTCYIFHQREYPRERKLKVIYALFQFFGSRSIKKDPFDELRKCDQVFAIDTNYRDQAVTTAIVGTWSKSKSRLKPKKLFTRSFLPTSSTPEREAWKSFIEKFNPDRRQKYALIVDSEMGDLSKINAREIPVFDGFLLPENWQLNYATSDVNDDFAIAQMIRQCDEANRRYRSGA